MNLKGIILSETGQSQKDKFCMIPLYELPEVVKLIEIERTEVARGRGEPLEGGVSSRNGYAVSVWQDEKALEICSTATCI